MPSTVPEDKRQLAAELSAVMHEGVGIFEEEPLVIFMRWREWHHRCYWLVLEAVGPEAATRFENAGGGLHRASTKIPEQVRVLRELVQQLEDEAAE